VRAAERGAGFDWSAFADVVTLTSAEQKVAAKLHLKGKTLLKLSVDLWGERLEEARDRRLKALAMHSPRERQARRGWATRELEKELQRRLAEQRRANRAKKGEGK
jgi:hypothetical protein